MGGGGEVDSDLDSLPSLVLQEAVGVVLQRHIVAAQGDQVVSLANVDSRLLEGGTGRVGPVFALVDLRDSVAPRLGVRGKGGSQETVLNTGDLRVLSGVDVGVADVDLAQHLVEEEVQVSPMGDPLNQGTVLGTHLLPVEPMDVGNVKPVTEEPPTIVEDLEPLFPGFQAHLHLAGFQEPLSNLLPRGRREDSPFASGPVENFLLVRRELAGLDSGQDCLVFLLGELVEVELSVLEVVEPLLRGDQTDVVVRGEGKGDDAGGDVRKVHPDAGLCGSGLAFPFGFGLKGRGGSGRERLLVDLLGEGVGSVRGQREDVDSGRLVEEVIELVGGEGDVEVPLGEEVDVLPAGGEDGSRVLVGSVCEGLALLALQGVETEGRLAGGPFLGVDDPTAVRGPGGLGEILSVPLVDGLHRLGMDVQNLEQTVLVVEENLRAVWGPLGRETPDSALLGQGDDLSGGSVTQVDLILAALVGVVENPLSVRRPGRVELPNSLGVGEVHHRAVFLGERVDVPPGFEEGPLPCR